MMTDLLNCEQNTEEMEKRVKKAADKFFKHRKAYTVFEHGQWWVRWVNNEYETELYSVNDAEGPYSVDGFSFEKID